MKNPSKRWTLVYYSVSSNEIPNLSLAISRYKRKVGPIEVFARSRSQLEKNPQRQQEFIEKALSADVLVLTLMSGSLSFPAWEKLCEQIEQARNQGAPLPYIHIQPTGSSPAVLELVRTYADSHAQGHWHTLNQYHRHGGIDNLHNLLTCLSNICCATDLPCPPPVPLPFDGIYHPDLDYIPDHSRYLQDLDPTKPTVGIWFYQNFWATKNCAHIDALIHEIERQGANVLCVFHMRFKDRLLGNNGPEEIIEKYFLDQGTPVIDVLLSPVMFSLGMGADASHPLNRLGVPVIQALSTGQDLAAWEQSSQGLTNVDITIGVAQPELDGVLIGVPVAAKQTTAMDPLTGAAINTYLPLGERIETIVRLSINWARLRHLKNSEKKIAIVFHHYPPRNDRIGCASGLDSFTSVKILIDRLLDQGYTIESPYENGDHLAAELCSRLTADQRWLLPEQMAHKCEASIDCETALQWHRQIDPKRQLQQKGDWGEFPGELFVDDGQMYFPGLINGNVFLTIQPPRSAFEAVDQLYHSQSLSPPYPYTAQYRWIKEIFGADAVLHIGKHGSLEWLPGKAVGLSDSCWPDLTLLELPNIYPYIINDPGEGTQAKRRGNACIIDHLPPALTNADLDPDLVELESLLSEYREALVQDQGKISVLGTMIWKAATANALTLDLELKKPQTDEQLQAMVDALHQYLGEIADTTITDGLHVLGMPPQGEQLVETLAQFTRLENAGTPSLRDAVLEALGYSPEQCKNISASSKDLPPHAVEIAAQAHQCCLDLLRDLLAEPEDIAALCLRYFNRPAENIALILEAVRDDFLPRLEQTDHELTAVLSALDGHFVLPGPSGAPSRGQVNILPTGRNFYSVDPGKIPSPAAWKVGQRLAEAVLNRYLAENEQYPASIGMVLWASPTMRTKGDDVAQILALMGLRPIWQAGSGVVRGLEVIPLEELGRPRIDVIPRISGIFRDAFPLLVDLIDQGVSMIAALNEPTEDNYLRKHVLRDEQHWLDQGLDPQQAHRNATFRLFSAPPGCYGTGVTELVETKRWNNADELGEMYIGFSSYAYGKNVYGEASPQMFRRVLGRMEATVKNEDSREKDMMTCTDFYSHHGGLISAVRSVRGQLPFSVAGDSADPEHVLVRTTREEARHIVRARILNAKWLNGLKRHGFKGAGDISKAMDIIFGWDATADVIDDWMYQKMSEKVVFATEMQEWMRRVNPYALQNIIDKLLEAEARNLWQTDQRTLEHLRQVYLEVEGEIEEINE
ncbi:cobaltochelatase subunit CobN [Desulfobulbus rhabdoformis]|uniref:cobaltochelatase subunit CobN n=1 Tax=Desulfobulbus rhabdoformis TaxID=34032 RepID=UPI00196499AB|nr:cobaltochelatase subunit CobN [Desulfobulbus rhabdoformis]MBM9616151.1 cobaltochelatase subunit CobN [Desulfobulbus rhabdoformis]